MDHAEMVALIREGVPARGGVWADLGAGTGNFTLALAELLGASATLYALDHDGGAVRTLQDRLAARRPAAPIIARQADVTRPLRVPPLDGVLLANLLHFLPDQRAFLRQLQPYLRPAGRVLVVEYEQEEPLRWVPFPVPFAALTRRAVAAGLAPPQRIGTRRSPSSGRVLYAAVIYLAE